MVNALSWLRDAVVCIERSTGWDPHPEITEEYVQGSAGAPASNMDQPLAHYFVSSGHNSYLTGDQLTSESSTKTIITCLTAGCRVIELDVYNEISGFNGPVCKHGGTLTKPVSFQICVAAIRKHAFTTSRYPVIITLENHTDDVNQRKMAAILINVLGEHLFVPFEDEGSTNECFLSPNELQKKVLIRGNAGKMVPEMARLVYIRNIKFRSMAQANSETVASSSSFGEVKAKKMLLKAMEASGVEGRKKGKKKMTSFRRESAGLRQSGSGRHNSNGMRNSDTTNARLSSVGERNAGGDMDGKGELDGMTDVPADEVEEEAITCVNLQQVYQYTSRNLMRVYPGGMRVLSSNYNPCKAWALGASLAALNWQCWDRPCWVNQAKFSLNGGCGYVLKPRWMLDVGTEQNPLPPSVSKDLKVHVYSAYCHQGNRLLCWRDDLYVLVEVLGMPSDASRQSSKVANNTAKLHLDQLFTFPVQHPDQAILVLILKDDDMPGSGMDVSIGYRAIPLADLVEGQFKMQFYDLKGRPSHAWVKVSFEWGPETLVASMKSPNSVTGVDVTSPAFTTLSRREQCEEGGPVHVDDVKVPVFSRPDAKAPVTPAEGSEVAPTGSLSRLNTAGSGQGSGDVARSSKMSASGRRTSGHA